MLNRYSLFAALCFLISSRALAAGDVTISQVYGGGGSTTTPVFRYDYVELFNRSSLAVSLEGWSLQYASATGIFSNLGVLPLVNLEPGARFLIQCGGSATGPGAVLPVTPDATAPLNLSATSGKLALVRGTSALGSGGPSASNVEDFVAYGSATPFEGSGAAPGLSISTALFRKGTPRGSIDTDDNAQDFTLGTPEPGGSASVAGLVFGTQPGGAIEGDPFETAPAVLMRRADGQVDTSYSGVVTLALRSGTGDSDACLGGTLSVRAVAGVARFPDAAINVAGTGYVLTASTASFPSVDSQPFSVGRVSVGPAVVRVPRYGELTDDTTTSSSRVTATDALFSVQAALAQRLFTENVTLRADINRRPSAKNLDGYAAFVGDGTLSMADAARVLDLAVGLDVLNLPLRVTQINIGHGDAALIEFPNGQKALIDGGYRYANNVNAANNDTDLVPYLTQQMGVSALDYVWCSHAHADHVQATADVLRALPSAPGKPFFWSGYNPANKPDQLDALSAASQRQWSIIGDPLNGQEITVGEARVRMFSTHQPWILDGDESPEYNNQSIVFRLSLGKASFLFTGDAQGYISRHTEPLGGLHLRLLNELSTVGNPNYGQNLRAQVLKTAHHGSNDGTSAPWLDAVRPDIALLSYKAGYPNGGSYGYPHPETVDLLNARDIPGYQTTYHGHILIATDGNNIAVLTQNRHGTRLYPGRSWSSLSSSPSGPMAESVNVHASGEGCEAPNPQGG